MVSQDQSRRLSQDRSRRLSQEPSRRLSQDPSLRISQDSSQRFQQDSSQRLNQDQSRTSGSLNSPGFWSQNLNKSQNHFQNATTLQNFQVDMNIIVIAILLVGIFFQMIISPIAFFKMSVWVRT